ncbi:MAG TPA: penicillin-binding protein 2 [Bryobacteraceae bacterium]|nr:penicillin-binding protein 2 [Bryobacteraceae bacterium]
MILPPVDPNLEEKASDKPPLRDDTHFAASKIAIFQYVTVAIFLFLISGFWQLQVQNPDFYDQQAQANSIKSIPILAPRGRILDRDGRVIVDNHSSFSLILARDSLKMEHLLPIAQGLDLDYTDLLTKVERFQNEPKYVPIKIKDELTPADLAFVDSHADFFPEMVKIEAQQRLYPQNGMLAHVIGYTGEISEAELDSPEFGKYERGSIIGKFGIERQYNDWLTGVDGQRQEVVDNRGNVKHVLKLKPAIPGKDLQLTIDLDLQVVAELALEGRNGAVVALDPRTGEVLAMASRPTFDPNKFAGHISHKDWNEINNNPDHPMLNRAIQAAMAPGSTFKPIVAMAGLESGSMDDKMTVHCAGGVTLYGHYYKCHSVHGSVALHAAIVESCDSYFYTMGSRMGIDNIAYYGNLVGYGQLTGIDLPQEKAGIMPSPQWKLRNYREKWWAGETPSVAIGQGALIVTPLQMVRAISGLAMGGVWRQPHLVKLSGQTLKTVQWALQPDNVADVVNGMYGVVNEGGGTGIRARIPGIEVCGKTGTAQIASYDYMKAHRSSAEDLKENGWFVGFAPRSAPEIAVVALWEHSGEGPLAAPIVRDVIKAYFDKKARISMLQQEKTRLSAMEGLGLPVSVQALPVSAPPAVKPPAAVEGAEAEAIVPAGSRK